MTKSSKHASIHSNPFPICAGLELSAPQTEEGADSFWLNAEIVFGQEPILGEGVSFRLGVRAGFLKLALDGCRVMADTRYAMLNQPPTMQLEVKEEEIQTSTMKADGAAGARLGVTTNLIVGEVELAGKAARSRASERITHSKRERTDELRKVTARGTNSEPSWEIADPEHPSLEGRYLGKENLCQITPDGEIDYTIAGSFSCRKRDLVVSEIECGGWDSFTTNKQKLALAVIAERLGTRLEGEVQLCKSVLQSVKDEQ